MVFNECHLRWILAKYADDTNTLRAHRSLRKDAPTGRPVTRLGGIRALAHLGGLHHFFVRI